MAKCCRSIIRRVQYVISDLGRNFRASFCQLPTQGFQSYGVLLGSRGITYPFVLWSLTPDLKHQRHRIAMRPPPGASTVANVLLNHNLRAT